MNNPMLYLDPYGLSLRDELKTTWNNPGEVMKGFGEGFSQGVNTTFAGTGKCNDV